MIREGGKISMTKFHVKSVCVVAAGLSLAAVARAGNPSQMQLCDWEFSRDGTNWTSVTVPHDWAIAGPFDMSIDAQHVAVTEDGEKTVMQRVGRTGALPWIGRGFYRRTVELPDGVSSAELRFGAVMSHSEVFSDGVLIGGHSYGYAPFTVRLPVRPRQLVEVRVENLPQSSRWYPGAGIIRPVVLRTDVVCRPEEVFVRTERIEGGRAYVRVTTPRGERSFAVENPKLWTPETPHLYTLEPEGVRYGIRTVSWQDGVFRLNGERRNFRGVCLHHDLGPLGAAFDETAFRRQVRLLKEIGCDAIRTSHNIPSTEQLAICDEMGMMVMAESFDEWEVVKCENGYHHEFARCWRDDLTALVTSCRSHPSVVMWSIGNEIRDQATARGTELSRELQDFIHGLDPTRPVTQGHSQMPVAIEMGGIAVMDIPGVTYRLPFYEAIRRASRWGGVLGAETSSTVSSRGDYVFPDEPRKMATHAPGISSSYDIECCAWSNLPDDDWAMQEDHDWVLGEFVWTGFDYLGEPTPHNQSGSRSSYFGIYDMAGLPKDRAFLYRSHWRKDVPTLHVLPHWTWPERIGQKVPVYVYTSYPSTELFVNGVSQGRRTFDPSSRLDRFRLRWRDVVYEPGELKVVAYDAAGRAAETRVLRTAGAPKGVRLEVEPLSSPNDTLRFVRVQVVDGQGVPCPRADNRLSFSVGGGGRYVCACNGSPRDLDPFAGTSLRVYNGQLVVTVAPGDSAPCVLTVSGDGLASASVSIGAAVHSTGVAYVNVPVYDSPAIIADRRALPVIPLK